jgi:cytochrome c biogenesis protein CcmG/thiol:disulfide interchange protein DsbE
VINFWASWCAPCRVEAPVLKDLAERRGVTVYGVVYKDTPDKARAFLTELGNPFAKIVDDREGRVGIDWGVTAVPETFVIDAGGTVRVRFAGALTDEVVRDIILPALRS